MCQITDQGLSEAKTGTLQVVIKFRVLRCTQPAGEVAEQYERTVYLAVTEKTFQYLIPKLEAIGYNRDGLRFLNLEDPQHHDLRGQEVEMYCQHENDNTDATKQREKWDIAARQSKALDLTPADAKALRTMDALYGRARKNAGLTSKPASARPVPVEPDGLGIDDSEIPF